MKISIKNCANCKVPHEWEYDTPTLKELRYVKSRTEFGTYKDFSNALTEGDPDATTALMGFLHRRLGVDVPWDEIELDYDDFQITPDEAETSQEPGKEEPAVEAEQIPASSSGDQNVEDLTPR